VEEQERRARLESRLRDYHGVGIDDVLEVVDYLRADGDTVIAGGSLAWDLGNRLSDFDVVICGPETSPSRVPLEHWVKTLRVDGWTRSHAGIGRLFDHAATALDGDAPIQGAFGTTEEEQQLKLLHRVAFGLRINGPALVPATSRDHLGIARDLLVREYAERMRESALVAQLAARAGRGLAAATNARLAVEECLHTVLATRGVPFTGDKWLQERLRAVAPDLREHHDRFSALPAPEETGAFVTGAVELCGRLTGRDLTEAALAADLTWSAGGVRTHSVSGDHFLVVPEIGAMWRLDDEEIGVWRGLTERAEKGWRGADCSPPETDLLVRLYERGLTKLEWDRGIPVTELEVARA
jgi:hypothetical protein